jgi:putative spermidine/putrescine transport system substrate-binding protein
MSWAGGWGQALKDAVSEPFSRMTGIPVRHVVNIGLKLPTGLVKALHLEERPPFDVVWSNSVAALQMATLRYCDPLDEETAPSLKSLFERARPSGFEISWPFASAYVVYYVLTYRTEVFPLHAPDTWEVILEPRFKNKVALYPGGNGIYPLAQILGGGALEDIPCIMEPCWDYLRKLRPQVNKLDYSIAMGEMIRRRELDIAFRALTNAIAFRNEGLDVLWAAPKEGVTDTTDALWVPRNLPENVAYWAKQYINFALSREVQQNWCCKLGTMPMNRQASTPAMFSEMSMLPRAADDFRGVLHISDEIKMTYETAWEAYFSEIFSK